MTIDDLFGPIEDRLVIMTVDNVQRVFPALLFQDVADDLADKFRRAGLDGIELDMAIEAGLPAALARVTN